MAAQFDVRGLSKMFKLGNGVDALKGIDLTIEKGEAVAIVGPSGAGKSTLLHILGTIDRPTSGSVKYSGQDIFRMNDSELAQFRNREIGFVFQFHHLLPEFNALENVMMPALIKGDSRKESIKAAREILENMGLHDRLDHKPGELSGGEQQRVAVARSAILNPKVILADEPTGNLDSKTGEIVNEILFKLNREKGMTLIVITHSEHLAQKFGRVVRLKDGEIAGGS